MNILVVEDEENTLEAYKIALEASNHNVTIAENGEDAINIFNEKWSENKEKEQFNIILLDYKLPKISGLDVAKEILEKNPEQIIIFASAFVKELLKKEVKEITTNENIEFLGKPFDIETLLDKIDYFQMAEELSEFKIKINPDLIVIKKRKIEDILDRLKTLEDNYLK